MVPDSQFLSNSFVHSNKDPLNMKRRTLDLDMQLHGSKRSVIPGQQETLLNPKSKFCFAAGLSSGLPSPNESCSSPSNVSSKYRDATLAYIPEQRLKIRVNSPFLPSLPVFTETFPVFPSLCSPYPTFISMFTKNPPLKTDDSIYTN